MDSTTNALCALAQRLVTERVERIVLESTGDYWRPFYYILEAHGLTVWLVNANDVKQAPGRPKTDKLDAVWLAKLNERGMLRPSFVPPKAIRGIRDFTRLRHDLVADRTRHKQRLEKLLEDALIKLSVVATNFLGLSGRAMIEALIAGQRDPEKLADLALGKLRVKRRALIEALTGRFDDHHATIAAILLRQIDTLTAEIDQITVIVWPLPTQPATNSNPTTTDPTTTDPIEMHTADATAEVFTACRHLLSKDGCTIVALAPTAAQRPTSNTPSW